MSDTTEILEQRLLAGYRRQSSLYERALRVIEERSSEPNWAQNLHAVLEEVTALEAEHADTKVGWQQTGRSPGPELRVVLERLGAQIQSLRAAIDNQVAEITARKERLMPEVDDFIRRRWMLNAYGQSAAKS
ncbi:MAG TPA: hypothetical protein VFE62_07290 [Gemmataceae bacterium]|nr:hypothetical protein [Gemmataceae bacterium]